MLKNAKFPRQSLAAVLALLMILSSVFVSPMSALASAESYTAEDLGLLADTVYDFNDESKTAVTDYGEFVAGTDGTNGFSAKSAINDKSLYVYTKGDVDSALVFDAYSNIETFSFDMKIRDKKTTTVNVLYYYDPITKEYSALNVYDDGTKTQVAPIKSKTDKNAANLKLISWDSTLTYDKWFTVKLTYGTDYAEATDSNITPNTVNSKYLTNITVTDTETGTEIASVSGTTDRWKRSFAYGVDKNTNPDATEPENIKIGFIDYTTRHMDVDNMIVTYRNYEKVQTLIDAIGDIEYTPDCLAKIEKAEAAYNLLSNTQKSKITYDFAAAYSKYYALGKESVGLHSDTVYDFNDESKTAVTDYGAYSAGDNKLSAKSAITDKSLLVWSTGDTNSTLLFDAYSNIKTFSFDIKMYSTANSVNIAYYYNPETNEYSALNVHYANNKMQIAPIRYSDKYPQTSLNLVTWECTDATEAWYTVKLTYGTKYATATDAAISANTVNSKYITNITVTDANGKEVANASGDAGRWARSFAYGVDKNANPDATEPENVKIGFIDGATRHMYIDNMTVTYRNTDKVQDLIDEIGEIEYTAECLAKIEKAEAAFNLLSDTEKKEISYNFAAAYNKYNELGRAAVGLYSDTVYNFDDEGKTAVTDYGAYSAGDNKLSAKSAITDKSLLVWSTGDTNSTLLFDAHSNIETFSFDIKMYSTANSVNIAYYYNPETNEYSALNVHYANNKMQIAPIRYSDKYPQTSLNLVTWTATNATETWYTVKLTYGTDYVTATDTAIGPNAVNSKYITNITVTDAEGTVVANESGNAGRWARSFAYGVDKNIEGNENATEPENIKIGFVDGATRHMYIDNMVVTYDDVATVKKLIADIGEIEYTDECLAKIEKAEAAYNFLTAEQKTQITYDFAAAKEECSSSIAAIKAVNVLIDKIGVIEYTDECLANIQAAEEAFNELTDAQKEYIDYDFAAAYEEYESLSGNEFGIKENTVYNFDDETKTNITDYATIAKGTDGTEKFSAKSAISEKTLLAWSTGDVGSALLFNTEGGIGKYSFDIKMKDTANSTKIVYFYDDKTKAFSAIDVSYATDTEAGYKMIIKPVDNSSSTRNVINYNLVEWKSSAPTETWYTVTLTYGTKYETVTYNGFSTKTVTSKYITNITVTETATNTQKVSTDMIYSAQKRALAYGVDRTNDEALTDSEDIKIGFMDNSTRNMYIDNMIVTYRNVEIVQGLIEGIGEIDGSDECYAKIVKAEEAYNLLSDAEKSEITYDFEGKKAYCKVYAAIKPVQDKIDAIGTIDGTNESYIKIQDAEEAYDALTDEQKAFIDYDFNKAWSDWRVANVQGYIDAIGDIVYTDVCLEKLDLAKDLYDELTAEEQAQITYDFAGSYAKYNSLKAVADCQALIDAIGEIEYTDTCLSNLDAAKAAYDALSEDEKAQITYDFAGSYAKYNSLKAVAEVEALVDAIGEIVYTDECLAKIDAAKAAYDALNDDEKAQINYDFDGAYAKYDIAKKNAYGIYDATVYNFDDETKTNVTDYGTYVNGTDGTNVLSEKTAIKDKSLYVYTKGNVDNALLFDAYSNIETYSFDIKVIDNGTTANICYYYNPETKEYSILTVNYADGIMKIVPLRYSDKYAQTSFNLVSWEAADAKNTWYTVKLTYGTVYATATDTAISANTVNSKYITNITVTDPEGNIVANESGNAGRWVRSFAYGVDLNANPEATEPENIKIGFVDGATRHMYIDNMTVTYNNVAKVQGLIDEIGEIDGSADCYARIEKAEEAYNLLSDTEKAQITYDFDAAYKLCEAYPYIKSVKEKIDAIGTIDGTNESYVKIQDAEEAYDALTDEQKALIDYDFDKAWSDWKVAYCQGLVDAIGEIVHTEACLAKLDAAKAAYDELTAEEQAQINYNFDDAYSKYNSLGVVGTVQGLIDAIGTIDGSDECYQRIIDAEAAYNELTDEQKALIDYDFNKAKSDWRVAYVQGYIDDIGDIVYTDDCLAKLDLAKDLYDELTAEEQAQITYDFDAAYAEYAAKKNESYGIYADTVYDFDDDTKNAVTDYGTYVNGTDDKNYLSAQTKVVDKSLLVWGSGGASDSKLLFDAHSNIETFSFDVKMYSTANSVNVVYYYNPETNEYSAFNIHYASGVMQIAPIRYSDKYPQTSLNLVTWECTDATEAWYTVKLTYGTDYATATDTAISDNTVNSKYLTNITVTDVNGNIVANESGDSGRWARSFAYGVDLNANPDATEPENVKIGFIDGGTRHMYIDNMVVTYNNVAKVQTLIDAIGTIDGTDECYAKIQKAEETYNCLSDAEKAMIDYDFAAAYELCEAYPYVKDVQEKINAIGEITAAPDSLARIEAAEAAYNALDDDYKKFITYDFAAAYEEYEYLVKYDNILGLIDKIGKVEYTDTCLRAIEKAEAAYNELTTEQQADIHYDFEAKKQQYHALAVKYWKDKGVHGNELFNFNDGKALSSYTTKVDTNGNGTTLDINQVSIVDGTLKLDGDTNAGGSNVDEYADALFFDAYSNIETFSVDLKVDALQNNQATPRVVYYYNGNGWYSAFFIRRSSDTFYLEPSPGTAFGNMAAQYLGQIKWNLSDMTNGWVTIKLTYSSGFDTNEYENFDPAEVYSKYIEKMEIIDTATSKSISSLKISDLPNSIFTGDLQSVGRRTFAYGAGSNGESGTTEPAKVQVGFISNYDAPVYADNLTIAYRNNNPSTAAIEMINTVPEILDNTYVCTAKIKAMKEVYDALSATDKAKVTNAATLEKAAQMVTAIESVEELPETLGATVRQNEDPEKQNLRFTSSLVIEEIEGWQAIEYGTVMLPYRNLGNNDLTLNTEGMIYGSSAIDNSLPLPEKWATVLTGIKFKDSTCSMAIAARSYVKYSNGTDSFYIYSKNGITNPIDDPYVGTSLRSVYSTARSIAKSVIDTKAFPVDVYGAINYTESVTEGMTDISSVSGANVLEFIYKNSKRIAAIAKAQA